MLIFKLKKNSGEQENESIISVRVEQKNLSLGTTVCHHSAGLVMPNGNLRDRFFDPTLTLMIDSYIVSFLVLQSSRCGRES